MLDSWRFEKQSRSCVLIQSQSLKRSTNGEEKPVTSYPRVGVLSLNMIAKSLGNRWEVIADEQGEIQVAVGEQKYQLRRLLLDQIEQAGNIDYEGSIEPWSIQDGTDMVAHLIDPRSGRAFYFNIYLNPISDKPPFRRIMDCKLYSTLKFRAIDVV